MDCLRSFSLSSPANQTLAAPDFDTWTIGTSNFWSVNVNGSSIYQIRGFKNINIWGFEIVGDFNGSPTLASNGIVQDWSVGFVFNGQAPLIGGGTVLAPNFLSITDVNPFVNFFLASRYKTKVMLESPIQSVGQIEFTNWKANGIANENLLQIQLDWNLNFVFYYTFEGE